MVIFINDDNDDGNNVCKIHFYTIQDDRIIVGALIRNANNLQVRCLQIRLQIGFYINLVYIFYTTNVYHILYFTRHEWLINIICDMTVLFAFHSRKGYTIRYEEISAISINIIMVIEMSPSERR